MRTRVVVATLTVVAIAFAATACSDSDDLDTTAAATTAQAAIDEADSLEACPFGHTPDLVAALPDDLDLAPVSNLTSDYGQVFTAGDVDITYCSLWLDHGAGPISEIRLDASPGDDVDVAQYLDEEFSSSDDTEIGSEGSLGGGELSSGCWDDGTAVCAGFWQGDGLFVAAVTMGDEDVSREDALAIARTLVPLAVDHLAARTT